MNIVGRHRNKSQSFRLEHLSHSKFFAKLDRRCNVVIFALPTENYRMKAHCMTIFLCVIWYFFKEQIHLLYESSTQDDVSHQSMTAAALNSPFTLEFLTQQNWKLTWTAHVRRISIFFSLKNYAELTDFHEMECLLLHWYPSTAPSFQCMKSCSIFENLRE